MVEKSIKGNLVDIHGGKIYPKIPNSNNTTIHKFKKKISMKRY